MDREIIEEFHKRNGNSTFTMKEMMIYQIKKGEDRDKKIDKLLDMFNLGEGKIKENRTAISYLKWIGGAVTTTIISCIFYIFSLIK